jgi:SAM-dependent methyltransferase
VVAPPDAAAARRQVREDGTVTRPEDVAHNRQLWDQLSGAVSAADGLDRWRGDGVRWGLSGTPEVVLGVLGEVAGRTVVELGCGVAPLSAHLARQGARVIAVDLSWVQLATARSAQAAPPAGGGPVPRFPLLQADAERLPLADCSADLVLSEHGVAAWCEPEAWIGEVARVLRPGGRLVFLTNSPLSAMCVPAEGGPATDRLLRGPADLAEVRWPGGGVEHHPAHGAWIGVLTAHGLVVEALHELPEPVGPPEPDPGAGTTAGPGPAAGGPTAARPDGSAPGADAYGIADAAWTARWPVEDLWVARRRATAAT